MKVGQGPAIGLHGKRRVDLCLRGGRVAMIAQQSGEAKAHIRIPGIALEDLLV
jgi:hypothetical protein